MSAATTADAEATRTGVSSVLRRAFALNTLGPLGALVLACLFFSIRSDRFFTGANFSLIVQQVMVVGTLAIGQTLVILTAGIDLSNGAVMALGNIAMTRLAVNSGLNPFLAILLGLLLCAGFGLLNGGLVTTINLPPFIVTLGTLNIALALTHIYSNEQTVSGLPTEMTWFGNTFRIGQTDITYGTVLMLVLYLVTWFVLRQTAAGQHVYAVGNEPEAARLSGIRTKRVLLVVYTTAGLIYGIGSWLLSPGPGSATPTPGRPTTSTASPPSCSAARASSAGAAA